MRKLHAWPQMLKREPANSDPLSGLVVRVSMKPVSTMQIGSGQNCHCGKGSAIDFVADAKVEAYVKSDYRYSNPEW